MRKSQQSQQITPQAREAEGRALLLALTEAREAKICFLPSQDKVQAWVQYDELCEWEQAAQQAYEEWLATSPQEAAARA